jgi:glutaredoxin
MTKELVMYTRTIGCPYVSVARRVLQQQNIPYREVFIDQDRDARDRVLRWTGFLSVPTLIVTQNGDDVPMEEPVPLPTGSSPRGIDRGAMITEPSAEQFLAWLQKHGLVVPSDENDRPDNGHQPIAR